MKKTMMDLTVGEHSVQQRGVSFWYQVVGTGPLLIVQGPGWGLGSEYLRNGLKPLEKKFTLIFYDTRGSGHSSHPADETRMSTTEMVEDLESLRQFWRLPIIRLLGHSHGGDISLGYAIRYSQRVGKLILVDSGINDFNAEAIIGQQLKERAGDPRFHDAIAALAMNAPPKTDLEFSRRLLSKLPLFFYDPDVYVALFEKHIPAWPSAWANRNFDAAEAKDTSEQDAIMNRVRASTLILVGRNDWVCPPIVSERIHRAIADSTLRVFDKTGHFPWIEAPQQFFESVVAFLETSPSSA